MKKRLPPLLLLALFLSAVLALPAWADHVARVKDFPGGDGVAAFLDTIGREGVLVDDNHPIGENAAIFVAPKFPESAVGVYECTMDENFKPVPNYDKPMIQGRAGFSLLFYCNVAEGMPSTIVVVTEPDGFDYYWAPAYSGVDGSLVTNDEFVPWQEASEGYVRLTIRGTNVNMRPQPRASGNVLAKMNDGDVFFAERWPITNEEDGSEWYKIILPAWGGRFKPRFGFVGAQFAKASPLEKGDADQISRAMAGLLEIGETLPENFADDGYGRFNWNAWQLSCAMSVGASLPDIVQRWGEAKIERRAMNFIDQFVIMTHLEQKDGFAVTFYEWPPLPGVVVDTFAITSLRSLYVDRAGAMVGGLVIGRDGKNRVRELLGAPHTEDPGDAVGEFWRWGNDFDDLVVRFDKGGLVSSVMFEARVAD